MGKLIGLQYLVFLALVVFIASVFLRKPQTAMPNTTTAIEVFGVKIEKNPPRSKLDELAVSTWPKYSSEPSKIPWTFKTKETMYIIEGKVKVSVEGHEGSFEIGGGDLVAFPEGMKITWEVLETMSKHYKVEK